MVRPFFALCQSNHSLPSFITLIRQIEIKLVTDIRKATRSRANTQFNEDTLPGDRAAFGPSCRHFVAPGALRAKATNLPRRVDDFWRNGSFQNYADYALTPQLRADLTHLREEGCHRSCAVMWAEAVWWRSHGRIGADYLIALGETVLHVMGEGRLDPHG